MWFGNRFLHTPASQEEAEGYLMSACMLGDKTAQGYYGGWLVNRGKSLRQARGIAWLKASVAQGHASAMYNLADALRKGKGVEVDADAAHALLEQGAALGNSECQCFFGHRLHVWRRRARRQQRRAHDLFQIASLQGDLWATYLLGITY
jgi:TPR repeat protein